MESQISYRKPGIAIICTKQTIFVREIVTVGNSLLSFAVELFFDQFLWSDPCIEGDYVQICAEKWLFTCCHGNQSLDSWPDLHIISMRNTGQKAGQVFHVVLNLSTDWIDS